MFRNSNSDTICETVVSCVTDDFINFAWKHNVLWPVTSVANVFLTYLTTILNSNISKTNNTCSKIKWYFCSPRQCPAILQVSAISKEQIQFFLDKSGFGMESHRGQMTFFAWGGLCKFSDVPVNVNTLAVCFPMKILYYLPILAIYVYSW